MGHPVWCVYFFFFFDVCVCVRACVARSSESDGVSFVVFSLNGNSKWNKQFSVAVSFLYFSRLCSRRQNQKNLELSD